MIGGAVLAPVAWVLSGGTAGPLVAAFCVVMVVAGVVDARERRIPNRLTYPSLIAFPVAVAVVAAFDPAVHVTGALIGGAVYGGALGILAIVAPSAMGMGDAKLAAVIGVVLGALGLPVLAAGVALGFLGGAAAAAVLLIRGGDRRTTFPFGPFLAAGAIAAALLAGRVVGAG